MIITGRALSARLPFCESVTPRPTKPSAITLRFPQAAMKDLEGYARIEGEGSPQRATLAWWPRDFASPRLLGWAELAWRSVCLLMFISGAVMMLVSQCQRTSDRDCAAQLSIWCSYES